MFEEKRRIAMIFAGVLLLAVPTRARSQDATVAEESTSRWQLAAYSIDWKAVEDLQAVVLDYWKAGAIGGYEIRIRRGEKNFDAWVNAEIVDAIRLGELRDLETVGGSARPSRSPRDGR